MARKTEGQTNIYSSSGRFIASQPYELSEWIKQPEVFYDKYEPGMIGTDLIYDFPTIENGQLREMTLEEQLTSGLRVLGEGQLYDPLSKKIVDVPKPEGMLKHVWDYDKLVWYEGSTKEELQAWLSEKVYTWRDEIWEEGFTYTKLSDGSSHHQRLRKVDSDRITETAQFMDKARLANIPIEYVEWQFSEDDIVKMSYSDINELFIYGASFTQAGFTVMANWRTKENVNLLVDTKDNFRKDMFNVFEQSMSVIRAAKSGGVKQ